MGKFIALVGMCGSGKSIIADELVNRGFKFFRFGQLTLDIIKEQGLEPNETNERKIREELRLKHGMGAYAKLNIPKIDSLIKKGNVVGDGLYSWSEYKILKDKYGDTLVVIAVYAPPKIRYSRLSKRKLLTEDKNIRYRPISQTDAETRDYSEIEKIEKGGPIAMADYTILNTKTSKYAINQLEKILKELKI